VVAQPEKARAALVDATAPVARATGLNVPGRYRFHVEARDGQHTVGRDVLLRVFDGNQPPVPVDVHNRIPVWVRTTDGGTLLRAAAWDIEGDAISFEWSVRRQPEGASARLESADKAACKVTGMTVAGDYVFGLRLSDPTHTVTVEHTVPVYH
jgi:hypothetical protein